MAEEKKRRCRRSRSWIRANWAAHLKAQAESGLSGVEYCRRHGLHPKSLYRWRRVFREGGGDEYVNGVEGADACAGPVKPVFAEVDVGEIVASGQDGGIEVLLASQRRLRVHQGFDEGTLRRVVVALESLPC